MLTGSVALRCYNFAGSSPCKSRLQLKFDIAGPSHVGKEACFAVRERERFPVVYSRIGGRAGESENASCFRQGPLKIARRSIAGLFSATNLGLHGLALMLFQHRSNFLVRIKVSLESEVKYVALTNSFIGDNRNRQWVGDYRK